MREEWLEVLLLELIKPIGVEPLLIVEIPDAFVEGLADGLDFLTAMRHLNNNHVALSLDLKRQLATPARAAR